jgi:hypothetical protein
MLAVMRRREQLLARSSSQREELARLGARWEAPLELADRGLAVVRYLRARPLLVAGAASLLVWRRRGLMGLVRTGWRVWKGYRFLSALSARLSSRQS